VTDTTPPIVLNQPRSRWWAWVGAALGLGILVVIAVASIVPADLFAETENRRTGELEPAPYARVPASAESVNNRVEYGDLPDDVVIHDTASDFYFVTVSAPEQSVLSWMIGSDEPTVDLLTEEDKNGRRTATQTREISLQQMRTATQEAQFVALQAAGYEPEITLGEVVIQDMLCKETADDGSCAEFFPSDEQLDPADTILEANDMPLGSVEDLTAALTDLEPGDTVDLLIRRPGDGEQRVTVELSASPDEPERTIIGFIPFDTRMVELPFDVGIDTGRIGGPSAGLAFTLSLIDELTDGELTGGQTVAVTGTINLDGSVGAIGGLEQKVNSVYQHGVRVFLVPASQIELTELSPDDRENGVCRWECLLDAGGGEVVIIPVATLDEALAALETIGGDPLVPVNEVESA